MKGRKLYLAGPVTGMVDDNRHAFSRWAAYLRHLGWHVVVPVELPEPLPNATWHDWMRICLPHVLECDVVAMLDGWEDSRGARLEYDVARGIGTPVVRVKDVGPAYAWPPAVMML